MPGGLLFVPGADLSLSPVVIVDAFTIGVRSDHEWDYAPFAMMRGHHNI